MHSDTSHIESRLFAHALNTGNLHDLMPSHFSVPEYTLLWRVMMSIIAEYGTIDPVLLGDYLLARNNMDKRDWLAYVASQDLGRPEVMPAYANALRDARHGETLSETLSNLAAKTATNPAELREDALAALNALPITGRYRTQTLQDALQEASAEIDRRYADHGMPGVTTGLPSLDQLTGGWQRSDLILLGARPAAGKTALMLNMVLSAARSGKSVGIISAEQPAGQLAQRLISLTGKMPAWKLRNPRQLSAKEWEDYGLAVADLDMLNIQIFDASAPDLAAVRVAAKGFQADLLFVDYVQRLKGRGEAIYDRVSYIAQGLKELARDLHTPVVALAQINRAGAGGAKMENLKGSGDLEQEADMVLLLERKDSAEVATLDLAKNRHGATGTIDLLFTANIMRFAEVSPWE